MINRTSIDLNQNRMKALVQAHSIPVKIKRFFTDVDGVIIDKNTAPAGMKTKYPFFVFGDFDKKGAYRAGLQFLPPQLGSKYLMSFVYGDGLPFLACNGFANVHAKFMIGDIIHVYTDNIVTPSVYVWIVVQNNFASISSITSNTETIQNDGVIGQLFAKDVMYIISDSQHEQWNESIHIVRFDNIGTCVDDQIQPYIFRNPFDEQQNLIRFGINFKIDQYIGFYSYIIFEEDELSFTFRIMRN